MNIVTEVNAVDFFKCLADRTRFHILMLIDSATELCVCELTHALELSQPKISRHLALLRSSGLLECRKEGKWAFYQISPSLPQWQKDVISQTKHNSTAQWQFAIERLNTMVGRPEKAAACCN